MRIFKGRHILLEKYEEPYFRGTFFSVWRNDEHKITRIQIHKTEYEQDTIEIFDGRAKEMVKNVVWILPYPSNDIDNDCDTYNDTITEHQHNVWLFNKTGK